MGAAISLDFGPEVSACISAVATGTHREAAMFGTRGDGKTWAALAAMIAHAQQHQAAGYPLPVKWAGVTDTFRSHTEKTHDSLLAPGWGGVWRLEDGGHEARCVIDGQTLVRLRLFGIEDQGAMNRLRMECHGLWFEEPAPALAISSGISEDAWALGLTSQRLPSHCKPALISTNYPDEDHWTWQRFVVRQHPGTGYFRIPPGERASPADRAEWERALSNRPDLRRRLLDGRPGAVILGEQVAVGFNEDVHVAPVKLEPGCRVVIGQDGGLTPTSVIGQRSGAFARVAGAVATEHGGIKQHVRYVLRPWLGEHAPWCLEDRERLAVYYDPSMNKDDEGDSESNALKIMQAELMGVYRPGPVNWEPRKNAMLGSFGGLVAGQPIVTVDPVHARALVRALATGWHYPTGPDGKTRRDEPVKDHPSSDYGDAYCYFIAGVNPTKPERPKGWMPAPAKVRFSPFDHAGRPALKAPSRTHFSVFAR